jgi:hypothetical protein
MAHFAKIRKSDNTVVHVSVVDNWNVVDGQGNEVEAIGIAYLEQVYGADPEYIWRQTSYNANMRKNYAGVGMTWDESRNAFIPEKSFNSWILNETTCRWEPPTPMPNDGQYYHWNESTLSWVTGPIS